MTGLGFSAVRGDYHLGAAALLNSLGRAGWRGAWHLYHADASCPPWAPESARTGDWEPFPGLRVTVAPLPEPWPLARWRVELALRLAPLVPAGGLLAYFDADLVMQHPWPELADAARLGLVVVEDVHGDLPPTDPRRVAWEARLAEWGFPARRTLDRYVNSGFFACLPGGGPGLEVLQRWCTLLDRAEAAGVGLDAIKRRGGPQPEWHIVDQDLFNAALLSTQTPVSLQPAAIMGFGGRQGVFSHAIESAKPWRRHYFAEALRRWPPRPVDAAYWAAAEGPAAAWPPAELRRRRRSLRWAQWLARWWRRPENPGAKAAPAA